MKFHQKTDCSHFIAGTFFCQAKRACSQFLKVCGVDEWRCKTGTGCHIRLGEEAETLQWRAAGLSEVGHGMLCLGPHLMPSGQI